MPNDFDDLKLNDTDFILDTDFETDKQREIKEGASNFNVQFNRQQFRTIQQFYDFLKSKVAEALDPLIR